MPNKNFGVSVGSFSKPRSLPAQQAHAKPQTASWSSLAGRTHTPLKFTPQAKSTRMQTFSLNTRKRTEIAATLFQDDLIALAKNTMEHSGGEFCGPAGKCRARITVCGGSAMISLAHLNDKSLGVAMVTWSEILAQLAWREMIRAYELSTPRIDVEVVRRELMGWSRLPRMATLLWPSVERSLDEEAVFLVESTFWVLGIAILEAKGAK